MHDGYIYVEVHCGMYGLPHAGLITQELLKKRLEKHGYNQSTVKPSFWKHKWRPIAFSLLMDGFGVKYIGKEYADPLIAALKQDCKLDKDWNGVKYCGISLDWDYKYMEVHLTIPGYVKKGLCRFNHIPEKNE